MTRLTRSLLQGIRTLLGTVVVVAVLELASALYLRTAAPRHLPDDFRSDSVARAMWGDRAPLVPDLDLLWRNEPEATRTQLVSPRAFSRADDWTVTINSEGFRGPERAHQDTGREVYRILCIGDSVTFGYRVDQDETFPSQLEDALQRRYPGRPIEVINAGVPGWSWVQGLGFLVRDGLALRPNLVVVAHGTDDQFWPARTTDREHIWLLKNPLLRSVRATIGLLQRTATYRAVVRLAPPVENGDVSPGCMAQMRAGGSCRRVSLEEIDGAVREMRRLTEAAGVDLLVMNLDFLETPAFGAVLRAAFRDRTPFIDHVARFSRLHLAEQLARTWELGVAAPRVPTIRLRPTSRMRPPRTQRVLLRVLVARPGSKVTVRGTDDTSQDTFDLPMYDDGTHGDEKADDAVFSVTVHVPDAARVLRYRFSVDGSPEYELTPSDPPAWTDHVLRLADDAIAPVAVFGERFLMADNAHPDAIGQQVIARNLAADIERMASFRGFVQGSDAADVSNR